MEINDKNEIVMVKLNQNEIAKNNNKDKKIYLIIIIIIIIIYFAIVISTELTYRKKLFEKSIKYQEDLREKYDKDSAFYNCWKFFSFLGTNMFCFITFAIIFLFFPLNKSFLVLQTLNFSNYLTNLFKMIYRNPRPYWESKILDIVCNSGYGNPSGHSLVSLSFFLVSAHIVTSFNFFRKTSKGKILRIIIFSFLVIISCLIIISRVLLSAHSINQIIYGSLLGIGIYFLEIYIISYHTYSSNEFIQHMTNIRNIIIYLAIYIIMIILLLVIYFSIDDDRKIERNIYRNVFNDIKCKTKRKYELLKNDGFTQGLCITSLLGAYLGIILLIYLLKKLKYSVEYINEFNSSSIKRWIIRFPILILSGIFFILYLVIPKSSPLSIIIIFKFAVAFFFTGFGVYFLGIFLCVYFNFSNENIKKIA